MSPADDSDPPKRRELAILVVDVLAVEPLTPDRIPPESLFDFVRSMHAQTARQVEEQGGTVQSVHGDLLTAIWGLDGIADAGGACAAALACVSQGELILKDRVRLRRGISVHVATCLCGFIKAGSRNFFEVMSDGLNLAHRLAKLNAEFGTQILATAEVRSRAPEAAAFRPVTVVKVKGKEASLELFEVLPR